MPNIIPINNFAENENLRVPVAAVQNVRRAILAQALYKPNIQQTLQRIDFKFHRSCSYSNLIRECNVGEGQTLLIFWGYGNSDSRITISMSASSSSSLHISPSPTVNQRDLRSTGQQTDISCRYSALSSSVVLPETEEQLLRRERIADSLTFSSPASSLPPSSGRSASILGSVCALLRRKQTSSVAPKEVCSSSNSWQSASICRICFGGASGERLVRPCACRGTVAAVHRSCLERWLLQAATSHCELCRHHYVVTRTHKWSWARSAAEWARSGHARALLADMWHGAALCTASLVGTARALRACDLVLQAGARRGGAGALAANVFSSLLIGLIGALNGLLTTWMLLKVQEHQASWRAWRDSTLHVRVALAEPAPGADPDPDPGSDYDPPLASSSSSLRTVLNARTTADRSTNIADPFLVAPSEI